MSGTDSAKTPSAESHQAKNSSRTHSAKSHSKMHSTKTRLLFLVATDTYFCSHRLNLAKAALNEGFEVALATRCTSEHHKTLIEDVGIKIFPLKFFDRSTIHPYKQVLILKELYNIYKRYCPHIVHHVAIKPVVFGSLVAKLCRVPRIINALGGLGYLFTESRDHSNLKKIKKTFLRASVRILFRKFFSNPNTTLILQNQDDINTLIKSTKIPKKHITLIPGAGIDISAFPPLPAPSESSPIIITCISRMLWNKGIGELVLAAKLLKIKFNKHEQQNSENNENQEIKENRENQQNKENQENKNANCDKVEFPPFKIILYGTPDPENPASINLTTLQEWHDSGVIEWRGHCDNILQAYQETHIAVLPSYREGMPKSLLEAASLARPIVTTDVPGCRDIVVHNENGLLVPPQNADALAQALMVLCKDEELRNKMGQLSRQRVETYFKDSIIHEKTIELYRNNTF